VKFRRGPATVTGDEILETTEALRGLGKVEIRMIRSQETCLFGLLYTFAGRLIGIIIFSLSPAFFVKVGVFCLYRQALNNEKSLHIYNFVISIYVPTKHGHFSGR